MPGVQKIASDPLELESQTVVSPHVDGSIELRSSERAVSALVSLSQFIFELILSDYSLHVILKVTYSLASQKVQKSNLKPSSFLVKCLLNIY